MIYDDMRRSWGDSHFQTTSPPKARYLTEKINYWNRFVSYCHLKWASYLITVPYTAWDIVAFADDVWREADEALRRAIEGQWQANVAATGGGHAQAVAPEWVERATDGFPYAPFMWDEERRPQLRADLDGLYGHLYGLTRISRGVSVAPTNPTPSPSCAVRWMRRRMGNIVRSGWICSSFKK